MARIRSIRPEFWTRQNHRGLSPTARLVLLGLISHADDAGRVEACPRLLVQRLFPFGGVGERTMAASLSELAALSPPEILPYTVNGQDYVELPGFRDAESWQYQMIQHPSKSRFPERPLTCSMSPHEGDSGPHEPSQRKREVESGAGIEAGVGEGSGEGSAPPPPDAGVAEPRPPRAKIAARLGALMADGDKFGKELAEEAKFLLGVPSRKRDGAWDLRGLSALGKTGLWNVNGYAGSSMPAKESA